MLNRILRAGVSATLFLGMAGAASASASEQPRDGARADRGYPRSLIGHRLNVGQGVYVVPAYVPVAVDGPYALTGEDSDAAADRTHREFTGPTGRWVEVGQGRIWVAPAP